MRNFDFSLRNLLPGLVFAICLAIVGGFAIFFFVLFGGLNLSARWSDPKPVYWAVHSSFKNSVWWRATEEVPDDLTEEGRIRLGAQHYANACAKCHGGPGLGQNPQALAMRPRPQHLASVVDQFSDGELHYILEAGVRMSAMPAWPATDRADEIWNVVAFIRQLPEMTADEYVDLLQDRDIPDAPELAYNEPGPQFDNGLDEGDRYPADEYAYFSPATEWRDFAIQGDVVQRCAACHGADGSGEATLGRAPNLTVLSEAYIAGALEDYAAGERKSGIMQIVAVNLSESQRDGLAEYYASLPDVPTGQIASDEDNVGEQIATGGKLIDGVPACVTCHNNATVEGRSVGSLIVPDLAGQSPIYIRQQLDLFAEGHREGGAVWKPMGYIAANLEPSERDAVAAWFSAQEPGADIMRRDLLASADPEAGRGVVEQVCSECHTERGIGSQSGDTPNLTLQGPSYLHQQLWKFREDIRVNSQMRQTARQISEEDIANAAAYFGSLEPLAVERDVPTDLVSAGRTIAENGLPGADVPSCLTCHGEQPTSEISILPRLMGQNRVYLEQRLDHFAGDTGDDIYALSPMHDIASRMSAEEREAVAAWFSAQPPLAKQQALR